MAMLKCEFVLSYLAYIFVNAICLFCAINYPIAIQRNGLPPYNAFYVVTYLAVIFKLTDSSFVERKSTNVKALYFCIGFVIVFLTFILYASSYGNIYRVLNGVDDCGNICGMKNEKNTLKFCSDNNKEAYPVLTRSKVLIDNTSENTTNYESFVTFLTCKKDVSLSEQPDGIDLVFVELSNSKSVIVISCIVALVLSCIFLVLIRHYTKYVVWTGCIGFVVFLITCTIILLVASTSASKENGSFYLYSAIIFGIAALFSVGLIIYVRKRIVLVIELFKEASKALSDVPLIIIEPLLTFVVIVLSFLAFCYFAIVTASSGNLKIKYTRDGVFLKAEYTPDIAMDIAFYLNILAFIWFLEFIRGCQHFVIARTICQWFFTRTKTKLESPIKQSFSDLIYFHIGSICFGSILMTIVKILRAIVRGIRKSLQNSNNAAAKLLACFCDCITQMLENIFQFFVRNAYVIVALEGTPFLDSGKRAFNLITKNLTNVIALNNIGDYVLFMVQLFVVLFVAFLSYELANTNEAIKVPIISTIVCAILAFIIIDCFVTVFDMTLDTLLICFCVDCEQNDGTTRPYFMSLEMMDVMKQLKQATGEESLNFGTFKDVEAGTSQPIIQHDGTANVTSNKLVPTANVETETQAMILHSRAMK